jgi:hypothetical protein
MATVQEETKQRIISAYVEVMHSTMASFNRLHPESPITIKDVIDHMGAIYTREELEHHISYAVAYMLAHDRMTAAEMKVNQDKLNDYMKQHIK